MKTPGGFKQQDRLDLNRRRDENRSAGGYFSVLLKAAPTIRDPFSSLAAPASVASGAFASSCGGVISIFQSRSESREFVEFYFSLVGMWRSFANFSLLLYLSLNLLRGHCRCSGRVGMEWLLFEASGEVREGGSRSKDWRWKGGLNG
ncbi:hypothetical protein Cni_G12628 [Canna indica]|uniref:Uncharacterized protein n=1 Tax=Canna indica TaxID=4628 RepID=A0AAQ3KB14_9LILI|nr:hypothetical protein Cni_G12628 [Canna indica]